MITACFDFNFYDLNVNDLKNSREISNKIKKSIKYNQILTSVKEIGLIEPIIIFINNSNENIILDGHLRVEVLKDLNVKNVHCLISPIEDCYSYNKRVNRLTIVQEQRMLVKAIESGVPAEKLSNVLGISLSTLIGKVKLSEGIAPEVMILLAEKNVPHAVFHVLKKIKPYKQIEMVNSMILLNKFTKKFTMSMLHAIHSIHLVEPEKKAIHNNDYKKNIERLEKEMAAIQIETENIKNTYAEDNLELVIIKNHLEKILNNKHIFRWLYDHHPEYLSVLKMVSDIQDIIDNDDGKRINDRLHSKL